MNLASRCLKIRELFDVEVKREKLGVFYRRNGVHWRATGRKFMPSGGNLELLEALRMEFAQDLAEHIVHGRPVIYFDETTLNSWCAIRRAWFFKGQKFVVPLNSDRGRNFTIFGAVGACLVHRHSYFEVHDSTNKIDFLNFVENLANEISPQINSRPWIVLDNHPSHVGRDRLEIM